MSATKKRNPHPDPLIDEIRAIRRAISEQFGNDVGELCEHLREIEEQHRDRVVRLPEEPEPPT